MGGVNLAEIYIANGMAVILLLGILTSNVLRLQKRVESALLYVLALTLILACGLDPILFLLDGKPGQVIRFILYIGNFWLYVSNLLFSPTFLILLERNIRGKNSLLMIYFIGIADLIGVTMLIINFFHPMIYYIDADNCYQRLPLFFVFSAIGLFFLTAAIYVYITARVKGGVFKNFPIVQAVLPSFIGLGVQASFYGISIIWPAGAIGFTMMLLSMQNQNILVDQLTGLYNRHYLETLHLEQKPFCMMMLDLNGFKLINDEYGHSEGDAALIATGKVLERTIGTLGTAVRFAGDEFIVLLNTDDQMAAEKCVQRIHQNMEQYNFRSGKPYELSLSIGWGVFDMHSCSMDEILQMVDSRMYEAKRKYYLEHDRRGIYE